MKPSNTIVVSPKYIEEKERQIADLIIEVERLQEQKQKVIALTKDGRFVEALQLLEEK